MNRSEPHAASESARSDARNGGKRSTICYDRGTESLVREALKVLR